MKIFGVASFFVGIVGLAFAAVRRGQYVPVSWPDHVMMFVGIAGTIMGLAIIFMRFN